MADTLVRPGSDAAVVRVHGTNKAIAISTDCSPTYCKHNSFEGGKHAVVETWRNLVASGALPIAITDCMNFGNPEKPEIMGEFVECIRGMTEACTILNYPVVSGNVSLYNETNGEPRRRDAPERAGGRAPPPPRGNRAAAHFEGRAARGPVLPDYL